MCHVSSMRNRRRYFITITNPAPSMRFIRISRGNLFFSLPVRGSMQEFLRSPRFILRGSLGIRHVPGAMGEGLNGKFPALISYRGGQTIPHHIFHSTFTMTSLEQCRRSLFVIPNFFLFFLFPFLLWRGLVVVLFSSLTSVCVCVKRQACSAESTCRKLCLQYIPLCVQFSV